MKYLVLFLVFLKIGAFSFGGGYGMISLIKEEVINHNWLSADEFLEMVGISEATPGSLGVNMASFVGYNEGGVLGAFLATFAICLPAFLSILLFAFLFTKIMKTRFVSVFLQSLEPVIIALIVSTGILMLFETLFSFTSIFSSIFLNLKSIFIFITTGLLIGLYRLILKKMPSSFLILFVSMFLGIIFYYL